MSVIFVEIYSKNSIIEEAEVDMDHWRKEDPDASHKSLLVKALCSMKQHLQSALLDRRTIFKSRSVVCPDRFLKIEENSSIHSDFVKCYLAEDHSTEGGNCISPILMLMLMLMLIFFSAL